jgi:HK97 family phage major capsid protein/HK97 family phage prohead protease
MNIRTDLMTRDAQDRAASKAVQRLAELAKKPQQRQADVGAVDVEARTVELSFSSDAEYQRWWGIEVLGHKDGEVRMDRLTDKAAVLWNHNWDDQRGVVESARIESDGKGRATIRMSKSDAGEQLLQDIADGIITKVSVGYMIHGLKLVEEREDVDVYRVIDWEPYEISLVSVPADNSVGVGRQLENPQEEQRSKTGETADSITKPAAPQTITRTDNTMNEKITRDAQGNLVRAKMDQDGKIVEVLEVIERAGDAAAAAQARGADAERARVRELTELGKTYNCAEKAMQFIADGKTAADLQRELLNDFTAQRGAKPLGDQQRDANLGMNDREVRNFSIMRAIRAIIPGASQSDIQAAAFELECSRAAEKAYGKNAKGIIIPNDVLASRTFGQGGGGSTGAGNNLVATNLLAGSFIELLRHKAWVMKRARMLAGLVGNVEIPRQSGTGQAYWVGEAGAPTASTPTIDQIGFTPKTVGAYTDITRRLMLQATPDAEGIVRDDLLKVMALEIDRVAIYGSGSSNQPKGLKNITGINGVDFATAGKPSFAELVDMETQIALDDADVDAMSYSFNAGVRGHCKTTLKFPDSTNAGGTIWEPGNTVNGYATNVSNQIAAGDVFFGNWMDLVIAMWGGLELTVDPFALSTSGGLRLIALQDIDINVRHVESFCYGSDTVVP